MKISRYSTFSLFFIVILYHTSSGGTILSSHGVGNPFPFPNTRSMGMGGITIAVDDLISISRTNPAGLHRISTTRLSLQYFYEQNNYKDREDEAVSEYANFDGFSFVLPLATGFGVATGLAPLTRVDYNLAFQERLADKSYTKSVEGQGGLNTFTLSLFCAIRSNLALGLSTQYLFGKTKEQWKIDYKDTGFTSTNDLFSTKSWGYGLTAGLVYYPFPFLSLGAVFTPKANLDTQTDINYAFKSAGESRRGSHTFPSSWGVGTAFRIGKMALLGVDFTQQNWTELAINNQNIQEIRNINRISFGGEILPTTDLFASFLKRIAYRFGFYYQPYFSLDPDGNTINEIWATMGLGFPLSMHLSRIDIAVSFGKRGTLKTNGLSENLFRLSLEASVGEKWFLRR